MSTHFDLLTFLRTTVKVTNTGDGLSKAMHVEPQDLSHRDTVYVVLECEVIDVQTPVVKDTDGNELRYVLKAGRGSIVDKSVAGEALDKMSRKIEEAAGIERLFDDDGEPIGADA